MPNEIEKRKGKKGKRVIRLVEIEYSKGELVLVEETVIGVVDATREEEVLYHLEKGVDIVGPKQPKRIITTIIESFETKGIDSTPPLLPGE